MTLQTHTHVCPVSHAGILSTNLRRFIQNPDKILASLIRRGQTVLDIGCGPGFFTLAMARLVGDEGLVMAFDIQQEMLDIVESRAKKENLASRIKLHLGLDGKIDLDKKVDFALAFYVLHEVPDQESLLQEIYDLLKPGGTLLLVEPKFHVSASAWKKTRDLADKTGLKQVSEPGIALSRAVLLRRD